MGLFNWFFRLIEWVKGLFRREKPVAPIPADERLPIREVETGIPVYTVYIPTLDGRFDYLGIEAYSPGEIVIIPFGAEDQQICGIVKKRQRYPVDKLPLPLWKMKYILGKAPEVVVQEYLRQKSR